MNFHLPHWSYTKKGLLSLSNFVVNLVKKSNKQKTVR
jgi:hypothetical protein